MYATQELRDDHKGILIMLSVLEQIGQDLQAGKSANIDHLDQILNF